MVGTAAPLRYAALAHPTETHFLFTRRARRWWARAPIGALSPPYETTNERYVRIHVSENASIAVEMRWPATSRGIGLPGSARPLTVMRASVQPTNRLGM